MTPAATKLVLAGTLAVTVATFVMVERAAYDGTLSSGRVASFLWLLTVLFVLRVAGQVVVVVWSPAWLPPMNEWNLVPYRVLLPAQVVVLAAMVWIDVSLSADSGPPANRAQALGWALIAFSVVYAGAMVLRYVIRMRRRPAARWFGGTSPIVFHLVLATYLYTLGSFHAGR